MFKNICISLLLLNFVSAAPILRKTHNKATLHKMLYKYYIKSKPLKLNNFSSNQQNMLDDQIQIGISELQRQAGLPETGLLDEKTYSRLTAARCDNTEQHEFNRKKRDSTIYWNGTKLYYKFLSYTPRFSLKTQSDILSRAFSYWSQVIPINFTETNYFETTNLSILFAMGSHGDGFPFDGPNGIILAHTYFPLEGKIHINDEKNWTHESTYGYNLLQVAVHEIGHSLGLNHSTNYNDIMYAFYQGYNDNLQLTQNDIARIQNIYGPRVSIKDPNKLDDPTSPTIQNIYPSIPSYTLLRPIFRVPNLPNPASTPEVLIPNVGNQTPPNGNNNHTVSNIIPTQSPFSLTTLNAITISPFYRQGTLKNTNVESTFRPTPTNSLNILIPRTTPIYGK